MTVSSFMVERAICSCWQSCDSVENPNMETSFWEQCFVISEPVSRNSWTKYKLWWVFTSLQLLNCSVLKYIQTSPKIQIAIDCWIYTASRLSGVFYKYWNIYLLFIYLNCNILENLMWPKALMNLQERIWFFLCLSCFHFWVIQLKAQEIHQATFTRARQDSVKLHGVSCYK